MKVVFKKIHYLLIISLLISNLVTAQSRNIISSENNQSNVQLVVCSQNLKNYNALANLKAPKNEKESALVKRFSEVGCDVIAVQEIVGSNEQAATDNLLRLAKFLKLSTGREFDVKAGELNDATQRVGFLVAKDRAEISNTATYKKLLLPKLDESQKPRLFVRAPLEIQLSVNGKKDSPNKQVSLVNFHFKSKSNSKDDPAMLQWETYRMEMSEGLRRALAFRFLKQPLNDQILVVLGDRNSHFDTASAKILEGGLSLDNFKGEAICRINKRGAPVCQGGAQKEKEFISVITTDPETSLNPGTYKYNKTYSFLDDILTLQSNLAFFREDLNKEGNYDSGIMYKYPEASDHAMVWTKLRW